MGTVKNLARFLMLVSLVINTVFISSSVNAEEIPPYDYSSFVGDWNCYITGHTDGTTGIYKLSISAATENMICLGQMNNTWYQINGNKLYLDVAPADGLNFTIHHNSDIYAIELTFYDDSICMTAYSKERFLFADIEQKSYVDNYWFTSDTINPRRIETGNYSVVLNEKKLEFDQPPVMCGDRILVPLRKIFEELNAEVYYHAITNYSSFSDKMICIDIITDYTNCLSLNGLYQENEWWLLSQDFNNTDNNKSIDMDVSPILLNARTLVPVRVLTESLGGEVSWDGSTNTINISCNPAKSRRSNEEIEKIQSFTCDDALEFVKQEYFVPESGENGIDVSSISGEYVIPVDHKDVYTFDQNGKCYWFFICNGTGTNGTLAVYQDGTIIKQTNNESAVNTSYDYNKILYGDLSDFSGAWTNGEGYTMNLQYDGTEGKTIVKNGDGKIYGQVAEGFKKNQTGEYEWGIRFNFTDEENGSYGVWLYPIGINVIVNGQVVETDTSRVRIYAGQDFYPANEMHNKIYYFK